ncbi:MAG: hypothetical protein ACQKBT_03610 [Puniceicoccales bacterium]
MRIPLLPAFLCVLAIAAPGLGAAESLPLEKSIQPRAEESRWDYSSYYFVDGEVYSSGSSRERVVEVREIDGVTIFRVEFLMDWRGLFDRLVGTPLNPEDYLYYWEYFDAQGSHNFSEDFEDPQAPTSLDQFSLTLPFPVEEGHQYVADSTEYEVVGVDQEVTVPAGTFETVVYQMVNFYSEDPMDKDRQRFFMAPGVGLVRWEMDVADEQGRWVLDSRDDLYSLSL